MAPNRDTERTVVKTYVPKYQKDEWTDHAERLDMSHSEFVRSMVQAGRRKFDANPDEGGSSASSPGGDTLETEVLRILRERGACSWDELLDALSADLEDQLDDALNHLQQRNAIQHSGREGGYTLGGGNDAD